MQITLEKYCKTLSNYYNDWENRYEKSIQQLNYQLKSIDNNIYIGMISYSYTKKALCFPISAIYVSLFGGFQGSDNSYLYINKDKESEELVLSYVEQWSINFPAYETIFHQCYNQIEKIYKMWEEMWDISFRIENTILLDHHLWLLSKINQYGFTFQLSINPYGTSKRIEFQKENRWRPIYHNFSHSDLLTLQGGLERIFKDHVISVEGLENLFYEPVEPKRAGFWSKHFKK